MWARVVNILLGLWIMVAPAVLNYNKTLSNNNHIVGPLIVTFATIALWDINRNARLVNVLTGAWLIAAIFIFAAPSTTVIIANGIPGLLIIIFSLVKGKIVHAYGGGWRSLFQHNPPHMQAAEKENTAH